MLTSFIGMEEFGIMSLPIEGYPFEDLIVPGPGASIRIQASS